MKFKSKLPVYIKGVVSGKYTLRQAAESTGYTVDWIWKLKTRYLKYGDAVFTHGNTGKPSPRKISKEIDSKLVVTNDCHYIDKEDYKMHEILLCIQTNHTINDEDKMEFLTNEFYLKSEEEMRSLFKDLDDAFDNTHDIANRCNVEISFGERKLPDYKLPDSKDHFEYFKEQCYEGLYKKYTNNPAKDIKDRLEYELSVINKMGFVDYFLIVFDYVYMYNLV